MLSKTLEYNCCYMAFGFDKRPPRKVRGQPLKGCCTIAAFTSLLKVPTYLSSGRAVALAVGAFVLLNPKKVFYRPKIFDISVEKPHLSQKLSPSQHSMHDTNLTLMFFQDNRAVLEVMAKSRCTSKRFLPK